MKPPFQAVSYPPDLCEALQSADAAEPREKPTMGRTRRWADIPVGAYVWLLNDRMEATSLAPLQKTGPEYAVNRLTGYVFKTGWSGSGYEWEESQ